MPKVEAKTDGDDKAGDDEKGDSDPAPVVTPEKVLEPALAEAKKATEDAEKVLLEIRQTSAATLWEAKLQAAKLPPAFGELATEKFGAVADRRILESSDMDTIIEAVRKHWASVDNHY
ncbi:MAG: hypothetical protein IIB65_12390, partial [Proteobacteria bacterium]|nr:hypothetical protein [Pseudomonadota bacterium]